MYSGVFREDMFDEAEGLQDPYFRTKHDSEGLVRKECAVPWRIYRPAIVLGHSKSGEIDKIDGPYYFFTLITKLRETDRKSVVEGKSVAVRVDLGGRRIIKKQNKA